MKRIAKIVFRPDAPLHIYTNISPVVSRSLLTATPDSPPMDEADIYAPNDLPTFDLEFDGFRVNIELNLDLADNPLVKDHHTHASNQITGNRPGNRRRLP